MDARPKRDKTRLLAAATIIVSLLIIGSLGYLYIQAQEELNKVYSEARSDSVRHMLVLNNQLLVLESWVRDERDPECIAPVLASIDSEASTLAKYADLLYEKTGHEEYLTLAKSLRDLATWAHTAYNIAWGGNITEDQFYDLVYSRHDQIVEVTLLWDDIITHTYMEEIPTEKINEFSRAVEALVSG